ncbi:hypothetical protein TSOC_000381, partial [Tetrabaena socialis]
MAEAQPGTDAAGDMEEQVADGASSSGGGRGGGGGGARRGGGLLTDLAALVADADAQVAGVAGHEPEAGSEAAYWADQLRGYHEALLPRFTSLLPEAPALAAAAASASAPATAVAASSSAADVAPSGGGAAADIKA